MDKERITLEGKNFRGDFLGGLLQTPDTRDYIQGGTEEPYFFWRGKGMIYSSRAKYSCRFIFYTTMAKNLGNLEDEIIRIGYLRIPSVFDATLERFRAINPPILDKKRVYDFALKKIYSNAKKKEDNEIIPEITIPELKEEMLLKKGWISKDS